MSEKKLQAAPDFTLRDVYEESVKLSDYKNKKNVVLIFNRGFS